MHEGIECGLIGIDEAVKFKWDSKDNVEIRGINDFRAAVVDPNLPEDGLARRAVAVAAGIIVEFDMAAFPAEASVSAKLSGLAQHNGASSLVLFV